MGKEESGTQGPQGQGRQWEAKFCAQGGGDERLPRLFGDEEINAKASHVCEGLGISLPHS